MLQKRIWLLVYETRVVPGVVFIRLQVQITKIIGDVNKGIRNSNAPVVLYYGNSLPKASPPFENPLSIWTTTKYILWQVTIDIELGCKSKVVLNLSHKALVLFISRLSGFMPVFQNGINKNVCVIMFDVLIGREINLIHRILRVNQMKSLWKKMKMLLNLRQKSCRQCQNQRKMRLKNLPRPRFA